MSEPWWGFVGGRGVAGDPRDQWPESPSLSRTWTRHQLVGWAHGNDQVRFFFFFSLSLLTSPFLQLTWSFEALGDTDDPEQLFVEGLKSFSRLHYSANAVKTSTITSPNQVLNVHLTLFKWGRKSIGKWTPRIWILKFCQRAPRQRGCQRISRPAEINSGSAFHLW